MLDTSAEAQGRSWFRAQASGDGTAEISIYDEIGAWGITAKDFQQELKALGGLTQIFMRINSPGGDVFDGLAIYNMLKRHRASVTVTVDGIAASIASVVAMAGDEVLMPANAMMMVHDPAGVVIGTSKEMRALAEALDKVKQSIVSAYVAKSGGDRDEIGQLMADETWLTADEAVDLGLADGIEEPVRMAANFDLSRFKHPPAGLTARNPKEVRMKATNQQKPAEQAPAPEQQPQQPEQQPGQEPAGQPAQEPANQPKEPQQPAQPQNSADQLVAAERKRASEITAACALVGRHELASGFIDGGKTVGEVVVALQQQRAQGSARGAGEIVTHNAGGTGGQQDGPLRVDLTDAMRRRAGIKEG